MKKKVLAVAVASVLVAPSAFAAQDTSGMHFTSASEGFYASIRARLDSNGSDPDTTASLDGNTSRFGVRGTNDLGGGLEGFYQYEARVDIHNGGGLGTRLGNVGLRGSFGELIAGGFWSNDYNWTHGSTDIANWYSGVFNYTAERESRTVNAVQYSTPDLNGFQAAVRLNFHDGGGGNLPTLIEDDTDVDVWNIAAVYNVQGFTVAGSYNVIARGLADPTIVAPAGGNNPTAAQIATAAATNAARETEDKASWNARVGYAQDNWYVNGWYGEDNDSDTPGGSIKEDTEIFSLGGGVTVDKVAVYALYDTREQNGGVETNQGTVGVQYNIGAQSRIWIEYTAREADDNPSTASSDESDLDDTISVGLRHDF